MCGMDSNGCRTLEDVDQYGVPLSKAGGIPSDMAYRREHKESPARGSMVPYIGNNGLLEGDLE